MALVAEYHSVHDYLHGRFGAGRWGGTKTSWWANSAAKGGTKTSGVHPHTRDK